MAHVVEPDTGGDNLIRLYPGSPQAGTVGEGDFIYYQLSIAEFNTDLEISASSSLGDVGIYVSVCNERLDQCGGTNFNTLTSTLSLQQSSFNTLTSSLLLQHSHFNTLTSPLSL